MQRRYAIALGATALGAALLTAQEPNRSQPPPVSDSAGGFVVRRLEAPVTPDGKAWLRVDTRTSAGTTPAPDKSFALTLGDLNEEGDVARFRATLTPAGGRPVSISSHVVAYGFVSPDSRWVVVEPLQVIDVRAWRRYDLSKAFGVQPYVVLRAISADGRRLQFSRQPCAVDCANLPNDHFELVFPQAIIPDAFPIVAGTNYEGAIVPADSLWHPMHRISGSAGSGRPAWTPGVAEVDTVERHLGIFFKLAATNAEKVARLSPPAQQQNIISSLPDVLKQQTLRRHYYGVTVNGTRQVSVHAFVTVAEHWRSQSTVMFDGGCGQMWIDVSLTAGVQRFECGGFAEPVRLP